MYPDPKKVKDNRFMVRVDDYQYARLQRLCILTGEQVSTLARDMIMRQADRLLAELEPIMQPMVA